MGATLFWLCAAVLTVAALGLALRPLWADRRGAPPTVAHDVAAYKSQLAEIDRDRARGVLTEAEAEGARREVARRLLAADAERSEAEDYAPAPPAIAQRALIALALTGVVAAVALYGGLGAPARPGAPFDARNLERERMAALLPQAEAEREARSRGLAEPPALTPEDARIVASMRQALAQRPTDPEGRLLLGRALRSAERPAEAWPLLARAAQLQGEAAAPALFVEIGQAMIAAAGGYVSREAVGAFSRAPDAPVSQYMLGAADAQRGRNRLALERWTRLFAGNRNAAFAPALERQIRSSAEVLELDADALMARLGGSVLEEGATRPTAPGPTAEDVAAAALMEEGERAAMVEGMVAQLAERLTQEPRDLDGWVRLIRAQGALGRREAAETALAEARAALADDATALARLSAEERALQRMLATGGSAAP
ncbi:MAG: c-type cytochrome biogenesis protein CcmI [Pseudomonadota bacterium]